MTSKGFYLLDSDVFITAKNLYYSFKICPGFWKCMLHHHQQDTVFSIDRVRSELLAGAPTDDLVSWVSSSVPDTFFLKVDTEAVVSTYTEIMLWVQRHPNYFDAAKAKFATGADGWLVAYAKVHDATVVTNEKPAPDSKKEVKLPDVCNQFNVPQASIFSTLQLLAARFSWTPSLQPKATRHLI